MGTSVNQSCLVEAKKCNNWDFYDAPNGKIKSMLQAGMKQLAHMEKDIDIINENKNTMKGKIYGFCTHTENCFYWTEYKSFYEQLSSSANDKARSSVSISC